MLNYSPTIDNLLVILIKKRRLKWHNQRGIWFLDYPALLQSGLKGRVKTHKV